VSTNLEEIVEQLSNLSVLDMSKLKAMLEEKWGVKAAAAAAVIAAPVAGDTQAVEEATDFCVTLESVPADKKIAIIKIVREITGLGLKEAKDLVEAAPKVIKDSAPVAEANEIKKKIEEVNGKVSLKGL
jgi:large subunit ribosomal protein L7/L12